MAVVSTVIIPARDSARSLPDQLTALSAQHHAPRFEVIVIANRCTDGTAHLARSFGTRLDLRVIEANELASAAYARSAGASAATGRHLLFCDADDCVDGHWVAGMTDPLERRVAGVVGGRIDVNREGLPDWIYHWRYEFFDGKALVPRPLPYALSASLGVRREAFEEVGGFDPRFHEAGVEEVDLARRLVRAGFRIGEAPHASVRYEPRRTIGAALRQSRCYASGAVVLAAKEREPIRRHSSMAVLLKSPKTAASHAVRRREWRPHVLYVQAASHAYRLQAERVICSERAAFKEPKLPPGFVAPPAAPIVGGLCFDTVRAADARWYSSKGVEQGSLAFVERLLPEGVHSLTSALTSGCSRLRPRSVPAPPDG